MLDGRYRLVGPLGRGGFGDVWRAEELLPGGESFREVALKLLNAAFDDASWLEEAKNLASLRHPSLVTIFGAGVFEGEPRRPYVATELLIGETLLEILRRRRAVPWRRVLSWAHDVAGALDFIHERGVVHLDLKPGNLFWTEEGALKVLDFGISQRAGLAPPSVRSGPASAEIGLDATVMAAAHEAYAATCRAQGTTTARAVAGTPGFVAPEVLDNREATAASDAFALGVCIAQLATGRLPYAVEEEPTTWTDPQMVSAWWLRLRAATMAGELRDLEADPADLPSGLVALIRRLCAPDPAARRVRAGKLQAIVREVWERPFGPPERPFVGLGPYRAEDEGTLLGRDDDILRLGRELAFEAAVFLEAPRGAGKTSLIAAGLVPYLAKQHVGGKDDWVLALVDLRAPSADEALDRALAQIDPGLAGGSVDDLAAHCSASASGVVLAFDPLDRVAEIGASRRARFVAWLADAATRPPLDGLRFCAALDDDATEEVVAIEGLSVVRPLLRYVRPPGPVAAKPLVRGRATLAGFSIADPESCEQDIERELLRPEARLSTVAIALEDLAAEGRGGREISGARFRERGGLAGALARHADRRLRAMSPEDRAVADEILVRLSTTDGRPLSVAVDELCAALDDAGAAARVMQTLTQAGLAERRGPHLRIGHPALLEGWPHLVTVRLASMQRLGFLERLREAADAWDKAGGHPELLWGDGAIRELGEHEEWVERGIRPREREFIDESRQRSRRRRLMRWAAGLFALLVLGGLFVGQHMMEQRRRLAEEGEKRAVQRAYLAHVIARSRRAEDPYRRVAWLLEALAKEHADERDPALPLDLLQTAANLPRAHVITLEPVTSPSFPWGSRWLVGEGPGGTLSVVDFQPREADVIEDADLDADPEKLRTRRRAPKLTSLVPHDEPLAEWVPFGFDTALVTRSISGEVRVWRLGEDGRVHLAAESGDRCTGMVRVARSAPVVACPTGEGVLWWDLRREAVAYSQRPGRILDVSDDGALVVLGFGRRVALWAPASEMWAGYTSATPVTVARVSPRDPVVALVAPGRVEVIDIAEEPRKIFETTGPPSPSDARWDPGGVDLAVCDATRAGAMVYLRPGGRAEDDAAPAERARPCEPSALDDAPKRLEGLAAFGPLANLDVGEHLLGGGWQLPDGRWLTQTLVIFPDAEPAAKGLTFRGVNSAGLDEVAAEDDSVLAVERAQGDAVALQIGTEVRLYDRRSGERLQTRAGHLLGRCDDERLLAWQAIGESYRVIVVGTGHEVATIPRAPGFVLGVDPSCSELLVQRVDGAIEAVHLATGAARRLAEADGYVYDARPGRRGLARTLLAASSGALAEVVWPSGEVRLLGYASPRASMVGEGPGGEVLYADATGVVELGPNGERRQLLPASGRAPWSDVAWSSDGKSLLVGSVEEVGVLDIERRELAGTYPLEGFGRFAPWDADGSVLLWSYDRVGGAAGKVIPNSRALALEAAASLSNLTVREGELRVVR